MDFMLIGIAFFAVFLFVLILFLASRYKRCSSNQILVVYGKVGEGSRRAVCTEAGRSSGPSFRIITIWT